MVPRRLLHAEPPPKRQAYAATPGAINGRRRQVHFTQVGRVVTGEVVSVDVGTGVAASGVRSAVRTTTTERRPPGPLPGHGPVWVHVKVVRKEADIVGDHVSSKNRFDGCCAGMDHSRPCAIYNGEIILRRR